MLTDIKVIKKTLYRCSSCQAQGSPDRIVKGRCWSCGSEGGSVFDVVGVRVRHDGAEYGDWIELPHGSFDDAFKDDVAEALRRYLERIIPA